MIAGHKKTCSSRSFENSTPVYSKQEVASIKDILGVARLQSLLKAVTAPNYFYTNQWVATIKAGKHRSAMCSGWRKPAFILSDINKQT
jgi:hypothetical protein